MKNKKIEMAEDCDSLGSVGDASISITECRAGEGSPEHILVRKRVLGVVLPEPNYGDLFKVMSTVILSTVVFLLGGLYLPVLQARTGISNDAMYILQICLITLLSIVTTMILIYLTRRMKWNDEDLVEKPSTKDSSKTKKSSSTTDNKENASKKASKDCDKGSPKVP